MRIWKLTFHDPDHGRIIEWYPSRRAAQTRGAEIKGERDDNRYVTSLEVEAVPSNKAMLIDWLNVNFNRENG